MKFIKRTASVISSLIIMLAIGGFFFAKSFDLNKYKSYISDIVFKETGRKLTINGDAKLGISLIPTLIVNDVTFSNPEGANNPYMATLQKLEIKLAIMPLLKKQIVVDKLILVKPEIYLEHFLDGMNNWNFVSSKKGAQIVNYNEKQPKIKDASAALAVGLIAKEVILQEGVISYYNAKDNKSVKVIINKVDFETKGNDKPLNLKLDAVYDGQKVVADIEANTLNSLLNDGKFDFFVKAKILNLDAELSGVAEDVFDAPKYAVEGNIYNPSGNFTLPELSLDIRLDGNTQAVDVAIKNLDIATNKLFGSVFVDWSKSKPEIKADIFSSVFNVNSLGKNSVLSGYFPSIVAEAQALEIVLDEDVPYQYLKLFNANVNFKVGKLVLVDDVVLSDVVVNAKLKDGVLNVSKMTANIGGGSLNISAKVNSSQQDVSINLLTDNLKIQDLYQSLSIGQSGGLQVLNGGDLDIVANLSSSGKTYRRLSENLEGQVIAIVDKSEIRTGKFKWFANNIFSQLLSILGIDTENNTDMEVQCVVLRSDIAAGKAKFPDGIVFDASKLKVISKGEINLVNDKIDFTIAPSLNKLADGNITQALASFVKVRGTLNNPKLSIDKSSALTTVVGSVMTGGAYFGGEVLMNGDSSPCYTALKGTKYENRFPKSTGIKATTKDVYNDIGKQAKSTVKELENVAKDLLGSFKDSFKKGN